MATGLSKTKWNGVIAQADTTSSSASVFDVQLTYPGKKTVQDILGGPQADYSLFWKSATVNGHNNNLFLGDNLPILRRLLKNSSVAGRVKLIYIDPPYATNSVFQAKGKKDAYHDLLQGAEYLEFLRERLILMRELLSNDGSIYVHLDENMAFEIKVLMDEIFGKSNFRNWITRKKCSTKNTTKNRYGNVSDYILYYTKTPMFVWNRPYDQWPAEKILKEYPCVDPKTGRRYKKVPVHAPGERNGDTGQPWHGMMPPPGKHWQFTPARLDEMDANGEIYWSASNNPRRKIYFDGEKGIPKQDIWLEYRDSINQNMKLTGYPTEKNMEMLESIVLASSNPGDLVMDCFCGSGSTLQAAYKHDRQWIGVDNSIEAICTTLRRFHMGVEAMGDYVNPTDVPQDDSKLLTPEFFAPTLLERCPLILEVQEEFLETAKSIWNDPCPQPAPIKEEKAKYEQR
ncbi:MAG: site-specific DNA-methyltransferase [Bacillota bacterium]